MFAQLKDALTTLFVSMFSKKFIAFVTIAYVLFREKRWNELLIAFGTYSGFEVADKKIETKPTPAPSPEPIPPEATPEPVIEDDPDADAGSIEDE